MELDAVLSRLTSLPEKDRDKAVKVARAVNGSRKWVPNPGPQTEAYFCKADILGYGGQGGGGKSQLLLGLSFNEHRRSLLMRRRYADLGKLTSDAVKINGTRKGFAAAPRPKLLTPDDRLIEFGAAQNVGDEQSWQGQDHDLLGADEATQFLEIQIRFLLGWVRTEVMGQRTRAVLASNPPLTAEGLWYIAMFRAWLDLTYPKPAQFGELRYFVADPDGRDFEVPGPEPYQFPSQAKAVIPKSRTFIPAALADNPYYVRTGYQATLDALPEPLRSAIRDGNFGAAQTDAERQVIPTAWIVAAQDRWKPDGYKNFYMTAMAYDPAGGGSDAAELAHRYGSWYGELVTEQGAHTADGSAAAGLIIQHRRHGAPVVVDVGGGPGDGFGGQTIMRLKDNSITVHQFNGAKPSTAKTKGGGLPFANKRAEAWWRFREALDPDQEGGSKVALPPSAELRADLAAPVYNATAKGILLEDKKQIKKRIGRSPGKGDAVVMCWSEGDAASRKAIEGGRPNSFPQVNLGYSSMKRRMR